MVTMNPCQSYRVIATQTATPGQLVLMLYDGAIRFLKQAQEGFAKEDPLEFNQTIHNNITRAQAIIHELNETLNMEAGGSLAEHLRSLYDYMNERLYESNQRKEQAGIQDVTGRLSTLRDAWAEMLQQGTPAEGAAQISLSAAA